MNIVLAGMPGSGKTTVARSLKALGKEVFDTDEEIVRKYGAIADIFAKYGEEYFRNLETEAVKELCTLQGVVIATGGGCLLRAENVGLFKKCGKIVYLKTRPETLVKRVEGNFDRPLLQGDAHEKIYRLYGERAHIYEGAADITVDTDLLTPEEIADIILKRV